MSEVCTEVNDFIQSIFDSAQLDLSASVEESEEGCLIDIKGADSALLQAEGGELLEAIQHLLNQALGRKLEPGKRILCDVESFRATREAELRAMAQHGANQVRSTGRPFTFGSMKANERRIIHLTLAEDEDLSTESIGAGSDRRVKINLKPSD